MSGDKDKRGGWTSVDNRGGDAGTVAPPSDNKDWGLHGYLDFNFSLFLDFWDGSHVAQAGLKLYVAKDNTELLASLRLECLAD